MQRGAKGTLVLLGLIGLTATGCGQTNWTKAGVDEAAREADLARCEAYARDETEEDFVSRIEDTQRGVTAGQDALYSRDDLRRYDVRARRISLIGSCMRQLGYVEGESATDATEAPADAE